MKIDGDRIFMWAMGVIVVWLLLLGCAVMAGLVLTIWRSALA